MNVGDSLYLELSGLKSPAEKNGFAALATTVRNGQLVLPCWVVKNANTNEAPLLVWHHFNDNSGGPRVLQQVRAFFSIDGKQKEVCFPSLSTAYRCLNPKGHATFSKFRVYVKESDGSISSRLYSDFGPKNRGQGYHNSAQAFSNTFYTTLDGRLSRIYEIRNSSKKSLNESSGDSGVGQLSSSGGDLDATTTPKPKRRYTKRTTNTPVVQLTEQYNQIFAHENSTITPVHSEKRRPGRPKKIQSIPVGIGGVGSSISIQQMQEVTAQMLLDANQSEEPAMLTLYEDEPLLEPADYQPPPPPPPENQPEQALAPLQNNPGEQLLDFASYDLFSNGAKNSKHAAILEVADGVLGTVEQHFQVPVEDESLLQVLPSVDNQEVDNSQQPSFKLELMHSQEEAVGEHNLPSNIVEEQPAAAENNSVVATLVADDCPKTPNLDEEVLIPKTPQLPGENEPSECPSITNSSLPIIESNNDQTEHPALISGKDEEAPISEHQPIIAGEDEEAPTPSKRKSNRISKQGSKRVKTAKASKAKATKKAAGGRKKTIK